MIISLIVAVSQNNVIGKENRLPWHLPEDLKYFKNTTWAMPIVMGRKTWESLGKPLPGRTNIVISRNNGFKADGARVVSSLSEAEKIARELDAREIFIIGGAEIFNMALPIANRLYLTRIHHDFEGDVFFPPVEESKWTLAFRRDCKPDEKNIYSYSFERWEAKG